MLQVETTNRFSQKVVLKWNRIIEKDQWIDHHAVILEDQGPAIESET